MATGETRRFSLSEDWLATIIGLVIVFVIGAGLLGPGPQSVALKAQPGQTARAEAAAIGGWQVKATLAGKNIPVENAPTALSADKQMYVLTCAAGNIQYASGDTLTIDGIPAVPSGRVWLILRNDCDTEAALTYSIDAAIRWPVFNLFAR
jgi:hypothetical protein